MAPQLRHCGASAGISTPQLEQYLFILGFFRVVLSLCIHHLARRQSLAAAQGRWLRRRCDHPGKNEPQRPERNADIAEDEATQRHAVTGLGAFAFLDL